MKSFGPAGLVLVIVAGAARARPAPTPSSPLPFIEDDYPAALALAQRQGRPLFIDAWAPWCHTCLSLRQFVFTDPRLARFASRFVWLALDTEKASSAAFLQQHPIDTWPTLFVIAPPKPVRVRKSALTADELVAWLDGILATAPHTESRALAAEARVSELRHQANNQRCIDESTAALPTLPPGTSRLNVAVEGLTCAGRLPPGPARVTATGRFTEALEQMLGNPKFPALADDRSAAYDELVASAELAHDPDRVRAVATRWAAFLDREATRARTPAARAVFDSHRLAAALALKQPERAIPILQASERDFPRDYNPPARLARAYLAAGRTGDAKAAIDRALALAYGPRKKRLEALADEIAQAATQARAGAASP